MAQPLIQIVGGGLVGSAVTYGLTWWRERKRTKDAYRAPQRAAIGGIIAATNDLAVAHSDFDTVCNRVARYFRDEDREPTVTQADVDKVQQGFDRAARDLDCAFQVGRLTIVDASCYEKMGNVYSTYVQIKTAYNAALTAAGQYNEKKLDDLDAARYEMSTHSSQLDKDITDLVLIADDRVSPVDNLWNQFRRRSVRKRLEAEFFNQPARHE